MPASPASARSSPPDVPGTAARARRALRRARGPGPRRCRAAPRTRRGHGLGLGQEVEDPAAAVVEHDQPQRWSPARGREAAEVVREREVAEHRPGAAPPTPAAPAAVETSPSIPLAPRLEMKRTRAGPGGRKASRSRTGMLDAARTWSPSRGRGQRRPDARLAEHSSAASSSLDRVSHRASAAAHPDAQAASSHAPGPSGSHQARGEFARDRGRVGPQHRLGRARRFLPVVRWGRRRSVAAPGSPPSHWRSGLLVGMSPKRTISSGSSSAGPVARDQVVGRDDRRARSWGPQRSCEVGSARIGIAGGLGERGDRLGRGGGRAGGRRRSGRGARRRCARRARPAGAPRQHRRRGRRRSAGARPAPRAQAGPRR